MTDISREDLEAAASAGNGWAKQELIKRFGVIADGVIHKSIDDNETLYEAYQARPTVATLNFASVKKEEARDDHGRWTSGGGGGGSLDKMSSDAHAMSAKADAASNKADRAKTEDSQITAHNNAASLHADAAEAHAAAANAFHEAGQEDMASHYAALAEGHADACQEHENYATIDNGHGDRAQAAVSTIDSAIEPDFYAI